MHIFDCTTFMSTAPLRQRHLHYGDISELRRNFTADELSCLNSKMCPLLSQPTVTVFTYLLLQSRALSLHHSSVSFSFHHFSYLRIHNQSFANNPPPCFYLPSSFVVFSSQPCHFLFLSLTISDPPINSLPCCPLQHNMSPTCVIQGDLQPSVLSVLKAVCSHFDYFQVRHSVFVRNVTGTETHCHFETHCHLFDNVQTLSRNLGVIKRRQ